MLLSRLLPPCETMKLAIQNVSVETVSRSPWKGIGALKTEEKQNANEHDITQQPFASRAWLQVQLFYDRRSQHGIQYHPRSTRHSWSRLTSPQSFPNRSNKQFSDRPAPPQLACAEYVFHAQLTRGYDALAVRPDSAVAYKATILTSHQ